MSNSQALASNWPLAYIGKPYQSGARGPEAFDCWGLLWHVYKAAGIEIELYPGVNAADAHEVAQLMRRWDGAQEWEALEKPVHGCAVAMSCRKAWHHVGIYLAQDGGRVLHAAERGMVVCESLAKLRASGIHRYAFYKHCDHANSSFLRKPLSSSRVHPPTR